MTPNVDQDARRREIVRTASELVAAHGLEALTIRNVAAAVGASTTILTHYFVDKRDLMLATFRAVADRSGRRFDEVQQHGGDLRKCLEALLPLDPERQADWRLRTCFWGMCISDAALAQEEIRHVHSAHSRVEVLLRQQYPQAREADLRLAARALVTVIHGLGARHALDPDTWPAAEQRRILARELANMQQLARPKPARASRHSKANSASG
jgi:AcrR family transcriptional regulator